MPKRFCLDPTCRDYATYRGRCQVHAKEHDASIDRKGRATYSKKRWAILRRTMFNEDPWCRPCKAEGKDCFWVELDHITPLGDGGQEWARSNLQGLCKRHHGEKTRREQTEGSHQ